MKKLLTLSLVAVLAAGVIAPAAQANQGQNLRCEIRQTGPGSNNQCDIDQDVTIVCKNGNKVDVTNDTDQTGQSGDAINDGSTGSADATTGDVLNSNSTSVQVAIENGCKDDKDKDQPGNGGGPGKEDEKPSQPEQPAAKEQQEVANLPTTDSISPATITVVAAFVLGAVALVSRLGLAAYARFKA